jgi:predicted DNA-binding transcriptional regulator AlpA
MTPPRTDTDLRRIRLVAAHVGVSLPTIYRAAKRGLVTIHKMGPNMTFVSMAQVQQWIATGGNAGKVE